MSCVVNAAFYVSCDQASAAFYVSCDQASAAFYVSCDQASAAFYVSCDQASAAFYVSCDQASAAFYVPCDQASVAFCVSCDQATFYVYMCMCHVLFSVHHLFRQQVKLKQARVGELRAQMKELGEAELPGLLQDMATLQFTKILHGDCDLKIARQNYFTSKQDKVCVWGVADPPCVNVLVVV